MKIKNVKQTFLIFLSLIILSFSFYSFAENNSSTDKNIFLDSDQDGLSDAEEKAYGTDPRAADTDGDSYSDGIEVKSGYDPLKPAPGDKLVQEETATVSAPAPTVLGATTDEDNLTQKVSEKMTALIEEKQNAGTDPTTEPAISVADVQDAINEVMDQNLKEITLPEVSIKDIKIKEQNYSKLDAEEAKSKKREDFANYASSIFYIFSSNSPQPITSGSDINKFAQYFQEVLGSAITSRSASSLDDLEKSGDNMVEQLKNIEVPVEVADLHLQALRYALGAKEMKTLINPSVNDPLKDAANLTQFSNFMNESTLFFEEMGQKLEEYGLADDEMAERLKTLGVILPEETSSSASTSTETGTESE